MQHINQNIIYNNLDGYNKFINNQPYPHIVIENFLKTKTAKSILKNFTLNDKWTNYSFVNNVKKYGLKNKELMNDACNEVFDSMVILKS